MRCRDGSCVTGHFAAVHESVVGPSQHIAPPRILGRKRGIAEIDRPTSIAEGDARDPERTSRRIRFGNAMSIMTIEVLSGNKIGTNHRRIECLNL